MTKKEKLAAETRVTKAYNATCSGIQVSIMDLGKISAVGMQSVAAGDDDATVGQKIREYVETIRKN